MAALRNGDVAEWRGKGLQNPVPGFDSRRRLERCGTWKPITIFRLPTRALSSAAEHCLDTAGVTGSNPVAPTRRIPHSGAGFSRVGTSRPGLPEPGWSASGPRVVRETMKTVTRRREVTSLEILCATTDFGRLTNQRRDPRNPPIFPYKEEVGGSSPSTPTNGNPCSAVVSERREWRVRHPGSRSTPREPHTAFVILRVILDSVKRAEDLEKTTPLRGGVMVDCLAQPEFGSGVREVLR